MEAKKENAYQQVSKRQCVKIYNVITKIITLKLGPKLYKSMPNKFMHCRNIEKCKHRDKESRELSTSSLMIGIYCTLLKLKVPKGCYSRTWGEKMVPKGTPG